MREAGEPVTLIHHGANRGRLFPQNSLGALRHCLRAGARVVEVDITPTADGEFALLHDARLEGATTGSGRVAAHSSADLAALRLLWRGRPSTEPVGLLADALASSPNTRHRRTVTRPEARGAAARASSSGWPPNSRPSASACG